MKAKPGWYPDSRAEGQQRFWDGSAWTKHTAPPDGPPIRSSGVDPAIHSAHRVVGTVGIIKWTVIALITISTVAGATVTLLSADQPVDTVLIATVGAIVLASAIIALLVWLVFGLTQHTLGMLALIATNTTPRPKV